MLARFTVLAALLIGTAQAQTQPAIRDLGPEAARSAIYVGNSFSTITTACMGMSA